MKIATILGTRPEIIKLSSLISFLQEDQEFDHFIIHTGQHYDYNMDKVFFEDLRLPKPKYTLDVGSHPQGKQTALLLERIEEVLLKERPELVIVEGDTNTTLAGALAATKIHLPVMHIESGCRSFNRAMPEEVNRVIVDHIADYLIAPDDESYQNLVREGINTDKIFLLGSTAFDAVLRNKDLVNIETILSKHGLAKDNFVLVTIHRAENTDNPARLAGIIGALNHLAKNKTIVFPIHPRTKKEILKHNIMLNSGIKTIQPESYLDFLALLASCTLCMSDSGGIQEEAVAFNVPCLILREETEWIRLVNAGKNILVGTMPEKIISVTESLLQHPEEIQKIKNLPHPLHTNVGIKIAQVIKQTHTP